MNCAQMMRLVAVAAALLAAWVLPARAENYAFLVAVQDYDVKQLSPLKYTRNDILEFATVLKASGFTDDNVKLLHDDLAKLTGGRRYVPEADKIRTELDILLSRVEKSDTLIVAFAGHGVQFRDETENYFCPADADLEDPARKRLISFKTLYATLEKCPARQKLLLVDACRNDPLSTLARSQDKVKVESVTRPQLIPPPEGLVALFSCAPGQQSFEWPELKHGIFFHHVLEGWRGKADNGDGKLLLDELVAYSKSSTSKFVDVNLKASQTPRQNGSFDGEWILRQVDTLAGTRAGEEWSSNGLSMKMVWCPADSFMMGSPAAEKDRRTDEDQVRVTLSRGFWLGKYEVTQSEWTRVMSTTPWKGELFVKEGASYPATYVSWDDAVEFCRKLTDQERHAGRLPQDWAYTLPTEAQWEYACRAGSTTAYSFGDNPAALKDYAWIEENTWDIDEKYAHLVGQKRANPWGLHDVHGNVWEWCSDWYGEKLPVATDPIGPASGSRRVYRGGGWSGPSQYARSAFRSGFSPGSRYFNLGFRVLRSSVLSAK